MKKPSLLSKVGVAVVIIFALFLLPKEKEKITHYHQSEWNHHAPDVERVVSEFKPLELQRVYGMVVSHHIPTTIPQLVEYYSRLKNNQDVKNIIIIGPDHNNSGRANISVSNASFVSVLGELKPIPGLAQRLQGQNLAFIDEKPFTPEHAIGSQTLVISKIFPNARVTPIILRSHTTNSEADALGRALGQLLDESTVLVASVDFSHYLEASQATPIDAISGEVVKNLRMEDLSLIQADSGKSMRTFIVAMNEKKVKDTDAFMVLNSTNLRENSDYTTGYIFGFWGIK